MANANLQILTTANSFLDWLTVTNNEANNDNTLRNGNYFKDGGNFYIGAGILSIITPTGTTLQVQANASIANLLTVGQLSVLGNIAVGNIAVTQNTSTGNLSVTGNLASFSNSITVTQNATIGNLTISQNTTGGNATFANLNVTSTLNVQTLSLASGLNVVTLNVSTSISNAHDILVTQNTTSGNIKAVQNTTSGNITATQNISTGNISVTQNISTGNVSATNVSSGNVIVTQNVSTGNLTVTQNASHGNSSVTQNSTSGNVSVTQNVATGNLSAVTNVTAVNMVASSLVQGSIVAAITELQTAEVGFTTGTSALMTGSPTTYGSVTLSGSSSGYAGIQFTAVTGNRTFMIATNGTASGLYNVTGASWDWTIQSSVLYGSGSGPISLATGSTLQSSPADGDDSLKIATTAYVVDMVGGSTTPASSLGSNGYQKFASGFIIQWGSFTYSGGGASQTFSFPIAFPSAAFSWVSTEPDGGYGLGLRSLTASQFTVGGAGGGAFTVHYIAVGH